MTWELAHRLIEIALAEGKKAPEEIVIAPPGWIDTTTPEKRYHMTEQAATSVVKAFQERGLKLPIDWEHASVIRGGEGLSAPAAGWITDLRWESQRGLIATVEWNDDGRADLEGGRYAYYSPVFALNKDTREPVLLHSVALTNKPATKRQQQLIAASEGIVLKENEMTKDKGDRMKIDQAWLTLQDEVSIAQLVQALTKAGVEVDASNPSAVIMAAIEFISKAGGGGGEPAEGDGEEAAATSELLKELKVKTSEEALVKLRNDYVAKHEHVALSERLDAIERERRDERINDAIERYQKANKIADDDHEKKCRVLADKDFDAFVALMDAAPASIPAGRMTPKEKGRGADRKSVITEALTGYASMPSMQAFSKKGYVNQALREKDMVVLTDDELKTLLA